MKKKIKDMTYEEMQEICKYYKCDICPLNIPLIKTCMLPIKNNGCLDKEIEVVENEK